MTADDSPAAPGVAEACTLLARVQAQQEAQRQRRARQVARRAGRHAPDLWPVWIMLPLAVLVAAVFGLGIYAVLDQLAGTATPTPAPGPAGSTPSPAPAPAGQPRAENPLEVLKATVTVAGFFAAVLAGVYAYRKQRHVEGDAARSDAEQLATRYSGAADQLGHDKPAVRLAGVYAMARLADDWEAQRQTCIDVLCAYLRMPYDPDPASDKHKDGEREVRHTIIRVIRDHLTDPHTPTRAPAKSCFCRSRPRSAVVTADVPCSAWAATWAAQP